MISSILLLAVFGCVFSSKYNIDEIRRSLYNINLASEIYGIDETFILEKLGEENVDDYVRKITDLIKTETSSQEVVSRNGQKFVCSLPQVTYEKDEDGPKESFNPKYLSELVSAGFYINKCIKRDLGWWKYEVCHGQTIKQIHGNYGDKDYTVNSLGIFTGRFEMPDFLESTKERLLYFEEIYDGGTPCDLADNNNMRRTALRFECEPKLETNNAYISDIQEISSCYYLITIKVGSLCKLKPFIVSENNSAHEIICKPFISTSKLADYLKNKVRIRKLKNAAQEEIKVIGTQVLGVKRRKTALSRTSLLRKPVKNAKRLSRVSKDMDVVLEKYFNTSYIAENGQEPGEEAMKSLKSLAAILGGVDMDFTDYFTDEDEDRAYLWYYFHDKTWPKEDYPPSLSYVDISNEYYEAVKKELGMFNTAFGQKIANANPFIPEENYLIAKDEIASLMAVNLTRLNRVAPALYGKSFIEFNLTPSERNIVIISEYITYLWADHRKILYDAELYKKRAIEYVSLVFKYIELSWPVRYTLEENAESKLCAAYILDRLIVARTYALQTFENEKESSTKLLKYYLDAVLRREKKDHAILIESYKNILVKKMEADYLHFFNIIWKDLSESMLKKRRFKKLDKQALAEKIRGSVSSDKIVTEATISREELVELLTNTDIDKSALKIEFYDVSGASDEEASNMKYVLQEELEELRNIRRAKEAFNVYEKVLYDPSEDNEEKNVKPN